MIALISLGFLIGLDNLRLSASLGMLVADRQQRWRLAAAFGLCEAIMPLLGLTFGQRLITLGGITAEFVGPIALVLAGLLAIYSALRSQKHAPLASYGWLLWILPLALSLDNLLAGVSLITFPASPVAGAIVIGIISGLLAMAGLWAGAFLNRRLAFKAELIGGLSLIGLAFLV
jgi:putative Mn2+ efflux pump MntP